MQVDSTHYFIRHIYVYQVNNPGNIYIDARADNLPKKIKSFLNGIINACMSNDHNGARKLFLDHLFSCPEIHTIL